MLVLALVLVGPLAVLVASPVRRGGKFELLGLCISPDVLRLVVGVVDGVGSLLVPALLVEEGGPPLFGLVKSKGFSMTSSWELVAPCLEKL